MKKLVVIYWSQTGNTEAMAQAVAEGAKNDETEVRLLVVDEATVEDILDSDGVALGCPSMGAEVLEEEEMEPFIESLANHVSNKPMILFGSYGWGNGEWMVDWEKRMKGYNARLLEAGLIVNEMPDEDGLKRCQDIGALLRNAI